MDRTASSHSVVGSLARKGLAALILLIAAWILLGFLVHIATAIFTVVVVIMALVALVWALRVLL
jgi:hypothetical protein